MNRTRYPYILALTAALLATNPVIARAHSGCDCTKECAALCKKGQAPKSCKCEKCKCHKKGGECTKHKHVEE